MTLHKGRINHCQMVGIDVAAEFPNRPKKFWFAVVIVNH
jgi:hypothetical protein